MKAIKSILGFVAGLVILGGCFSMAGKSALVWNLLGTQIEIGLNQRHSIVGSFDGSSVLSMQEGLSYRNDYDLVLELEKVDSEQARLAVLNQYIATVSNVISSSSKMISDEKSEANKYVEAANECKSKAQSKNSEFSAAVKKGDYSTAQKIADEIAQFRSCEASNQVYAKEHLTYGSTNKNISKLQKKVDYISENKETIAKYYEILKPDLLKELYDISQTVKVNF